MRNDLHKGIKIMLLSSFFTCTGQLFWKFFANLQSIPFFLVGTLAYSCGALLMVYGLRFGEFSVLHPMLGIGYVWAVILGRFFLYEPITLSKGVGIVAILVGLVLMGSSEKGVS